MKDAMLLTILIVFFAIGYLIMARFSRFMTELSKSKYHGQENEKTLQVVMSGKKSTDEISEEIKHFQKKYGQNVAIIFVSEYSYLYDRVSACQTDAE